MTQEVVMTGYLIRSKIKKRTIYIPTVYLQHYSLFSSTCLILPSSLSWEN